MPGISSLRRAWIIRALALIVLTPVLTLVAARDDLQGALATGLQLTAAMVLFQSAALVLLSLRARSQADVDAVSRVIRVALALAVGAALLVTAGLPTLAWLCGVAMFACFTLDALQPRNRPLGVLPLVAGFALAVCWVFAATGYWDAILWWTFPLAAFSALAIGGVASTATIPPSRRISRRTIGRALAGVGLFCSAAALLIAWRSPGPAILIALEGALSLLFVQRAARQFGPRGILGVTAAACTLAAAVFIVAV